MYYRDRDRLIISIVVSCVIYTLLFIVMAAVDIEDWGHHQEMMGPVFVELGPFPEDVPLEELLPETPPAEPVEEEIPEDILPETASAESRESETVQPDASVSPAPEAAVSPVPEPVPAEPAPAASVPETPSPGPREEAAAETPSPEPSVVSEPAAAETPAAIDDSAEITGEEIPEVSETVPEAAETVPEEGAPEVSEEPVTDETAVPEGEAETPEQAEPVEPVPEVWGESRVIYGEETPEASASPTVPANTPEPEAGYDTSLLDTLLAEIPETGTEVQEAPRGIVEEEEESSSDIPEDVVLDMNELVSRRQLISQTRPVWPEGFSADNRTRFEVVVSFILMPDGFIKDLNIPLSSGYPVLDSAVMVAMTKWRFAPLSGYLESEDEGVRVRLRYVFEVK